MKISDACTAGIATEWLTKVSVSIRAMTDAERMGGDLPELQDEIDMLQAAYDRVDHALAEWFVEEDYGSERGRPPHERPGRGAGP